MSFGIQVSNPRFSSKNDPEDETLDECIETSFILNSEMAIMEWHGVFIPLHYKYSISTMLVDVLIMLQTLLDNENGELEITWPSSDFSSRWFMSWEDDKLAINSSWNSVIGKTEEILNDLGILEIDKHAFIFEWKALLDKVICGLSESGYNGAKIEDIYRLRDMSAQIKSVGLLYR